MRRPWMSGEGDVEGVYNLVLSDHFILNLFYMSNISVCWKLMISYFLYLLQGERRKSDDGRRDGCSSGSWLR